MASQTDSIHLLPLRPTEMTQVLPVKVSPLAEISKPPSTLRTDCTGQSKWKSTRSRISS